MATARALAITGPWAGRCRDGLAALAAARTVPGLDAAVDGDGVAWLRGAVWDDGLQAALRRVPGLELFAVHGRALIPPGRSLPVAELADLAWRPLHLLLPLTAPPVADAGDPEPAALTLVPDDQERPPAALLLPAATWTAWRRLAPAIRLARLRVAEDGARALVDGTPLPPLAGRPLWRLGPLLVAAGWRPDPPLPAGELATLVGGGDMLLALPEGWERVGALAWAPARHGDGA